MAQGIGSTQTGSTHRVRAMRVKPFLAVVFGVFALAFIAAMAVPHKPYTRYQSFEDTIFDRLDWIYERIVYDPTPIDVLILGSSRTARGANVAQIEAALAAAGRDDLRVANISMPASGFDWRLTVLREALAHHPDIKLVIWELVEAFPRDGHQAFADLGTPRDILASPLVVNRNLPGNLARLPYRQLEYALASVVPDAFGHRAAFDPDAYLGPMPDHRGFADPDWDQRTTAHLSSRAHAEALIAESRRNRREITWPILPEPLGWIEFGVSRHYVQEAARLGEAHGFDMAFLFLPFFQGFDDAIEAEWVQTYGSYWAASWLKENPAHYADAAHAAQPGIDRIAPWIAERILTDLDAAE